jgi:hypothetical protein
VVGPKNVPVMHGCGWSPSPQRGRGCDRTRRYQLPPRANSGYFELGLPLSPGFRPVTTARSLQVRTVNTCVGRFNTARTSMGTSAIPYAIRHTPCTPWAPVSIRSSRTSGSPRGVHGVVASRLVVCVGRRRIVGRRALSCPVTTACRALSRHVRQSHVRHGHSYRVVSRSGTWCCAWQSDLQVAIH